VDNGFAVVVKTVKSPNCPECGELLGSCRRTRNTGHVFRCENPSCKVIDVTYQVKSGRPVNGMHNGVNNVKVRKEARFEEEP
jgi:predicted RNA-binding Zn-ribbon protein involved in translation (DUF1610 family)